MYFVSNFIKLTDDRTSLLLPDISTFMTSDAVTHTTSMTSSIVTSSGTTESTTTTSSIGQVSNVMTSDQLTTKQTLTTIGTVQTTSTSTPSQGSSTCQCLCNTNVGTRWDFLENLTLTREELEVYLEDRLKELRRNLTIDAKETSAFKNTKISASDSRPSSAAMGALGVVLMTVFFGLIILSDCITFFRHKSYNTRQR